MFKSKYPSDLQGVCNPWFLAAQAALIDKISMKNLLQFFDERIAAGQKWVVWYTIYPIWFCP